MLWHVPENLTPAEERLVKKIRTRSRFYVFLREIRHQLFDEAFQAELSAVYQPRGQEPVPPALLAMVMLLQAYAGLSDAAAVDEAEMDFRWQLVLGTLGQEDAPFGQGTLCRFRARMIAHDLDRRLLERTVELAKQTGAFGWKQLRVALDSSPLRGAGRVEDTWNLIGRAMNKLVVVLARLTNVSDDEIIEGAGLTLLQSSSIKAALDIDWDDREARSDALLLVLQQAEALLSWAHGHAQEILDEPGVAEATQLLERVIAQDTEPDPDRSKRKRILRGVAVDRVCSIGDPEMRHGRKSKSKAFNGYKRHIATALDAPLILDAHARPANQAEHESVSELLEGVAAYGTLVELYIDRGYLGSDEIMKLHRAGVRVRCRPWPDPSRPGKFGRNEFKVDLRRKVVRCPAGIETRMRASDGVADFGGHCATCKVATQCTDAKRGRSFQVSSQESLLRKLRRETKSERGREGLRTRVKVEHRLARVGQFQGRVARYRGERKNTLDLRRHCAVANLSEIRGALAA
jgi:IS5 family transposase